MNECYQPVIHLKLSPISFLLTDSVCFSVPTTSGTGWAGIWTRALTVPEMNMIDCNPGDADIGYDEFTLIGAQNFVDCSIFETF